MVPNWLFSQVEYSECTVSKYVYPIHTQLVSVDEGQVSWLVPVQSTSKTKQYQCTIECGVLAELTLPKNANILKYVYKKKGAFVVSELWDAGQQRLYVLRHILRESDWDIDTLINIPRTVNMDHDKHLSLNLNTVISQVQVDDVQNMGALRFNWIQSPDSSQHVLFTMESRGELSKMRAWRFSKSWDYIAEVDLKIDRGYILSNVDVDNRGNVYLLKHNAAGAIGIVRCNPKKEIQYQSISGTSTKKDNLRLIHLRDDSFGILKLAKTNDELLGLLFTPVSFGLGAVQSHHYEIEHEVQAVLSSGQNFHLAKVQESYDGSFYVFLEQRSVSLNGGKFEDFNRVKKEGVLTYGQISTGDLIIIKFDHQGNQLFQKAISKTQSSNLEQGLNEISFSSWETDKGLFVIYAAAKGGLVNNKLSLLRIDQTTGELKEQSLISPSKYAFQRWSLFVDDNKIMFLGKKGLVGTKLYKGVYRY